jgi:hypothetical protein
VVVLGGGCSGRGSDVGRRRESGWTRAQRAGGGSHGVRPGRSSLAQRLSYYVAVPPGGAGDGAEAEARGRGRCGFLLGLIWVLPGPVLVSRGRVRSTAE